MSDDEWQEVKGPRKRSGKGSRGTGPTTGGGGGRGSASPGSRGQGPSSSGRGAPDNQQPSTSRGAQDNQQPSTSRGAQNNQQTSDDKTGKNLDKLKWHEVKDYVEYKIERCIDIVDARKMFGYFKKHIITYDWGARRHHLMRQLDPTTPHSYYTDELYRKFKSLGGDTSAEYDRFFGTKFTAVFNIKRFQHTLIIADLQILKAAIQEGWVHLVVRLRSSESYAANVGYTTPRNPNETITKYTRYHDTLYILDMKLVYMVTKGCYSHTQLVQNESGLNLVSDLITEPVLDKERKPIEGKVKQYRVQKSNRNTVTADDVARAFKRPESENPFDQNRFKKYVIVLCEEIKVEKVEKDKDNTRETLILPIHCATSQTLVEDVGVMWTRYRYGPAFYETFALPCGKPMVPELYLWGKDKDSGEPLTRDPRNREVEVIFNRQEEQRQIAQCKAEGGFKNLSLKTRTEEEAKSDHQTPKSPYRPAASSRKGTKGAGQSQGSQKGSFPHAKKANDRFWFQRPPLGRNASAPDFYDMAGITKLSSIPEGATDGEEYGTMTYEEYWRLKKLNIPFVKNVTSRDLEEWGARSTKDVKVHYTSIWVDDELVEIMDHTDDNGNSNVYYEDLFPLEELPAASMSPGRNTVPTSGNPDAGVSGSPTQPTPPVHATAQRKASGNKRKAVSPLEENSASPSSPSSPGYGIGISGGGGATTAAALTSTPVGKKSVKRVYKKTATTSPPATRSPVKNDDGFVIHVKRLTGRDEEKSPGSPAPP